MIDYNKKDKAYLWEKYMTQIKRVPNIENVITNINQEKEINN